MKERSGGVPERRCSLRGEAPDEDEAY